MKELIRRAKEEKRLRKSQPCRVLGDPPDNGLLVPELVQVAHRVHRCRAPRNSWLFLTKKKLLASLKSFIIFLFIAADSVLRYTLARKVMKSGLAQARGAVQEVRLTSGKEANQAISQLLLLLLRLHFYKKMIVASQRRRA